MSIKSYEECLTITKNLVPSRIRDGEDYAELLRLIAYSLSKNYEQLNRLDNAYNADSVDERELPRLADTIDIIYPTGAIPERLRLLLKYYGKIIKNRGTMDSIKQMIRILEPTEIDLYQTSLEEYCDVKVTLIEKGWIGVEVYELKDIAYARRMLRKVIPAGYKFDIVVSNHKKLFRSDRAVCNDFRLGSGEPNIDIIANDEFVADDSINSGVEIISEDYAELDDMSNLLSELVVVDNITSDDNILSGIEVVSGDSAVLDNTIIDRSVNFFSYDSARVSEHQIVENPPPNKYFSTGDSAIFNESSNIQIPASLLDGPFAAWGNRLGAVPFGDGITTPTYEKMPVSVALGNFSSIYLGLYTCFGIRIDGSLWGWGYNNYGQVGDGTLVSKPVPIRIGTDKWKMISNKSQTTLGIKEDGTLWGWGWNNNRQVGDGTLINRKVPVLIGGSSKWKHCTSLGPAGMAIKEDGTLCMWGQASGFAGNGNDGLYYLVPTPLPAPVGNFRWRCVDGYGTYCLAIRDDGTLWSWGLGINDYGQLGVVPRPAHSTMTQVGNSTWKNISVNVSTVLGVKNDNTLWGWGRNVYGGVGDGTNIDRAVPVQIGGLAVWDKVSGWNTSYAIRQDGTLWGWGWNNNGQLGDGTTNVRNSPVQIGSNRWLGVCTSSAINFGIVKT